MNINTMYFTPKDVEQGEFSRFLNMLMTLECEDVYNELHIWSDGYVTIVEWTQTTYDDDRHFSFIDEDHYIASWNEGEYDDN